MGCCSAVMQSDSCKMHVFHILHEERIFQEQDMHYGEDAVTLCHATCASHAVKIHIYVAVRGQRIN